jgi:3-phenylpropionate/trans-cinnamate dioxygenase ferredoxin reductase component
MTETTFVIAGASLAGAKAAESLRKGGFDGRLVLIGEEPELPYERPPLSKDYLRGESQRADTHVHSEGFYAEQQIELRRSARVTEIRPQERRVVLGGGKELTFDSLLLTTGAEPRRLPIDGSDLDGIHYLRTIDDSEAIRQRLLPGARLVVVGAGWIGAEVAASARRMGVDVTMIDPVAVPLERVLGRKVGSVYADIHREHGVDVRLSLGVEGFEGDQRVERVRTSDGAAIECDFVVVGVGVAPRTQLAEAAGIPVDNGIVVNGRLETRAAGIFAAGDVANHDHPQFGRIRVEHWANALNQGLFAGKAMLGTHERYERVPYFYSDQYDVSMEYSGYASGDDEVVFRGNPESRRFIAFWLRDERVLAGMNVNIGGVTDAIQALVRSRMTIDRGRLSDPDLPLEQLVPAGESGTRIGPTVIPIGFGVVPKGLRVVKQAISAPLRFVGDRLAMLRAGGLASLEPGDGAIVDLDGEKVAAYRDEEGRVHAVSPICTHLRCVVGWNGEERTWDCPCHGSRFDVEGNVLRGPAKKNLERKLDAAAAG